MIEMSLENGLMAAVLGFAALAAGILTFSWVWARHACKPKRRIPDKTPADFDLPYETTRFPSGGAMLNGWLIPAKANPASGPTIILCHGWSRNASKMLPIARALHEAGFGVLLYDARGHGKSGSDGPITGLKFAQDLIAAIDYLDGRPELKIGRLGVVGHSLGGVGAILAASMEPRIRALVSISAFADPVDIFGRIMRELHIPRWPFLWIACRIIERWVGRPMAEVTPGNRISRVHVPTLLMHGAFDEFIAPSNMDTLRAGAPEEQVQTWLIPDGAHSDFIGRRDCGQWVVEFLQDSLRAAGTGD